jgi:hypothetical protein
MVRARLARTEPSEMDNEQMMRVENREALIHALGEWPTFHDAEVISVSLNRGDPSGPVLTLEVYTFTVSSQTDSRGWFVKPREVIVVMEFLDVSSATLMDFNAQNVLSSLRIFEDSTTPESFLKVVLSPLYGLSAEFNCQRARVRSVKELPTSEA